MTCDVGPNLGLLFATRKSKKVLKLTGVFHTLSSSTLDRARMGLGVLVRMVGKKDLPTRRPDPERLGRRTLA